MVRRSVLVIAASLLLFSIFSANAKEASAQFRIGPHVGYSFDAEELFLGAEGWIGIYQISEMIELHGNFSVSYYFVEGDATLMQFAFHVPFLFDINSDLIKPFVGPGIGIYYAHVEIEALGISDSDTDAAFNIVGGALFLHDQVIQPFAQLRLSIDEDTNFELMGGVMFQL